MLITRCLLASLLFLSVALHAAVPGAGLAARTIGASDEVTDGVQLIGRMQTEHMLPRQRAVQLYCVSFLNWNEFLFVD